MSQPFGWNGIKKRDQLLQSMAILVKLELSGFPNTGPKPSPLHS